MADNDTNTGDDIIISGPDDEPGDSGHMERVVLMRNIYRIDFEDGISKEYAAPNDAQAIYIAGIDRPDVERVQISRVRKDVPMVGRRRRTFQEEP